MEVLGTPHSVLWVLSVRELLLNASLVQPEFLEVVIDWPHELRIIVSVILDNINHIKTVTSDNAV
eukprot:9967576-Karenia_brevis.AAC.1